MLNSNLQEIINSITKDGIGCGWVKDNKTGSLLGIITDGDLRRGLENNNFKDWANIKASDLMSKNPKVVDENCLAINALKIMEDLENEITVLPIVKKGGGQNSFLGFLRIHDLIQAGF